MKSKEIQKHIDRVVGTEGNLRIPSWWMHKILSDLVKYCEEKGDVSSIKNYLSEYAKKEDIATINGKSIINGGNITIEGGGGSYDDTEIQNKLTELSEEIEGKEDKANKTTTLSSASTDTQYPSAKAVYDALQNVGGGMTTPSGDPMHYMFEAAGATYNATDADIPMVGVYGDSYVHKAHHWHLNELGDITNEEMRAIYVESNPMVRRINLENAFAGGTIRTNIAIWDANRTTSYGSIALTYTELRGVCLESQIEVFSFIAGPLNRNIQKHLPVSTNALSLSFRNASKLSKIIGCLNCSIPTDYKTFEGARLLKEVRLIRLKNSFSFADSPLLSKNSVLFAIQNAEATSAITITLHADAYARLAEDADIVAALAEKTNVSLASA